MLIQCTVVSVSLMQMPNDKAVAGNVLLLFLLNNVHTYIGKLYIGYFLLCIIPAASLTVVNHKPNGLLCVTPHM